MKEFTLRDKFNKKFNNVNLEEFTKAVMNLKTDQEIADEMSISLKQVKAIKNEMEFYSSDTRNNR